MTEPSGKPGKVLLVTGGSRGIGAAVCRQASAAGYRVVVNYVSDSAAADALVSHIRNDGGDAMSVRADVGREADILAMFSAIDEKFGRLDALVNNAGVVDVACRVEDMTLARIDRQMRINVIGSMLCAREAVKRMSTNNGGDGGVIVNLSSIAAVLGGASQYVDYAASKGAIDTFTKGLAREVAAEGIRVSAVRPGVIDTDIHASGGQPDRAAQLAASIPVKRPGTAEEIAAAVMWLLSDAASYATGAVVDVTGGR